MTILACESSCDETSVSILSDGKVRANLISSQDFHKLYGGVVPELSSRAHMQRIVPLTEEALKMASISINEVDYFAATAGPGLIGALMIGFTFAKGLALSLNKPFIPVNHIEGHIFSPFLMGNQPEFPMLCLVVSGGHTLLLLVKNKGEIILLGSTIDDAVGEAFDKVSKMIGLGYPGGPKIQNIAGTISGSELTFPVAETKGKYDFSFSGVKTSVLRYVQKITSNMSQPMNEVSQAQVAFAFQNTVVRSLISKFDKAVAEFRPASLTLCGGVAANKALRNAVLTISDKYSIPAIIPSMEYCGDNAAMIAYRAQTLIEIGETFSLDYETFPSFNSKYVVSVRG